MRSLRRFLGVHDQRSGYRGPEFVLQRTEFPRVEDLRLERPRTGIASDQIASDQAAATAADDEEAGADVPGCHEYRHLEFGPRRRRHG